MAAFLLLLLLLLRPNHLKHINLSCDQHVQCVLIETQTIVDHMFSLESDVAKVSLASAFLHADVVVTLK